MRCNAIVWVFGLLLVLTAGARTPGTAASVVDIKLSGAYFSEPATLQVTVTVERNDANRTLWIEADGEGMYTGKRDPAERSEREAPASSHVQEPHRRTLLIARPWCAHQPVCAAWRRARSK